jgi:hypothetical protein
MSLSKNDLYKFALLSLVGVGLSATLQAETRSQSSGLILLDPASARASSLGEAFSAITNDIAAFAYNPASLRSLSSGQASFMFQRGLTDDSRGRFLVGAPIDCGGVGLNVNYYDGGTLDLVQSGVKRSVTAKRDWVISLGAARMIGPVSVGVAAKHITSTIVETEEAQAWAADVGAQMTVHPRVVVGASLQNMGSSLKYLETREDLPRLARLGAAWKPAIHLFPLLLVAEAPYYIGEKEVRPALGAETSVGPLAFRVGYKTQNDLANWAFGAGFNLNQFSLDYSFGLIEDLRDEHNISFNLKFGGKA